MADRDWDLGRHRGWDRDWDDFGGGWRHGVGRNWDRGDWRRYQRKHRHYNTPYYEAWWYPYWNSYVAPIVNPIFSWFWPYPITQTMPYTLPTSTFPPIRWW